LFYVIGQHYIGIKPHDLTPILKRIGPIKAVIPTINRSMSPAPITIPMMAVDTDLDALAERLRGFLTASRL